MSITVIAWLLLVGCLFMPLSILLHAPAILFTRVATGAPAALFYGCFFLANLSIGIGLLQLRPAARIAAIAFFVFSSLNTSAFYTLPGAQLRVTQLMQSQHAMFLGMLPDQPPLPFSPTPLIMLGATVGVVFMLVPLYFLITTKAAFDRSVVEPSVTI